MRVYCCHFINAERRLIKALFEYKWVFPRRSPSGLKPESSPTPGLPSLDLVLESQHERGKGNPAKTDVLAMSRLPNQPPQEHRLHFEISAALVKVYSAWVTFVLLSALHWSLYNKMRKLSNGTSSFLTFRCAIKTFGTVHSLDYWLLLEFVHWKGHQRRQRTDCHPDFTDRFPYW